MSRIVIGLAVALGLAGPPAAAPDRRVRSAVESMELPVLSDPQLSSDGRRVLFVMDAPDVGANRRIGHVHRVDADGRNQAQLTFGERGESSPRWSPDGRRIAFLARRGDDAHIQLYLLEAGGGEARRLTSHPTAVTDITWSADSQLLFFVAAAVGSEAARERARMNDDVHAFEETDVEQRHLWVVDLAGKTTQITFGSYSVTAYDVGATGRIAMTRAPSPLAEHRRSAEVWVMDATGGNARRVTSNDVAERNPRLSPDGRDVLFIAAANGRFEADPTDTIFVVPASGGAARELRPDAPFQVNDACWSADGTRLYFVASHGVHAQLMQIDLAGGAAAALTRRDHTVGAWRFSPRTGTHAFTLGMPQRPAEVHLLTGAGPPRRVTQVFDRADRRVQGARQERLQWQGRERAPATRRSPTPAQQ